MKRTLANLTPEVESQFHEQKIFKISRIEKQITYDSSLDKSCSHSKKDETKDKRVDASSKVNFSKLTDKEQNLRFINQLKEIKRLTYLLNESNEKDVDENIILKRTIKNLHNCEFEIDDQRHVIENLSKAIITGRMVPNSFAFNQICTILRHSLNLNSIENYNSIYANGMKMNLTSIERETYTKLKFTDKAIETIIGKEHMG